MPAYHVQGYLVVIVGNENVSTLDAACRGIVRRLLGVTLWHNVIVPIVFTLHFKIRLSKIYAARDYMHFLDITEPQIQNKSAWKEMCGKVCVHCVPITGRVYGLISSIVNITPSIRWHIPVR
jgi:hypothetical protein